MTLSPNSQHIPNSKTQTAWCWSSCLTDHERKSMESTTQRKHQMNLPLTKFLNTWTRPSAVRWWTSQRSSSSRPAEEVISHWFPAATTVVLRLLTSYRRNGLQSCSALRVHQLFFRQTWVSVGDWRSAVGQWRYGWDGDTWVHSILGGRRDTICAQRKRFHLPSFQHSWYAYLYYFCLMGLSPLKTSSKRTGLS